MSDELINLKLYLEHDMMLDLVINNKLDYIFSTVARKAVAINNHFKPNNFSFIKDFDMTYMTLPMPIGLVRQTDFLWGKAGIVVL